MDTITDEIKKLQERAHMARQKAEGKLVKEGRAYISDRAEGPRGIRIPNSTQIPNEIIDKWMIVFANQPSVFTVLLYITRKTFGYNKIDGDRIPLSQIELGTGLGRETITIAIRVLADLQLIEITKGDPRRREANHYRLRLEVITH